MLRAVVDIATAISTALLVAIVVLNAYVVTLAIRASKTSGPREHAPTRH
jgi:hypothetical protein